MGMMCFDKRVLGGLAAVGVGVLIVAPNLLLTALPLLLLAICPLSMLFMGKFMMGGGRRASLDRQQEPSALIDAQYRVESGSALDRGEQVALLRAQLQRVGEQQAALAGQLARLEAADGAAGSPTGVPERTLMTNAASPSP